MDKKYIVKNLAPWMMDELLAFSKFIDFDVIFLREQKEFYKEEIRQLISNGVSIYVKPRSYYGILKKLFVVFHFVLSNLSKFSFDYNGVIAIKGVIWFLTLDIRKFSSNSSIHAQFATQATIVSYLIKLYYKKLPQYSFTFHANDIYFNNKWFKLITESSHLAFSISDFNVDYVKKKYSSSDQIQLSRLGVFRNNIKPKVEQNNSMLKIGILSWFVEKKGIIYLLKAIKELRQESFNVKLLIAGDGPLKGSYQDYIKQNQLTENVEFLGALKGKDKEMFYNRIDVFALPAIEIKNDMDGIPVVLMEAIAYGLPIISTKVSGIPEICFDKENGCLIESRNVNQIVSSIRSMCDYNTRGKYGINASEISSRYDIEVNSHSKLLALKWINN